MLASLWILIAAVCAPPITADPTEPEVAEKVGRVLEYLNSPPAQDPCDPPQEGFVRGKKGRWSCNNRLHRNPNRGLKEAPGAPGCPRGMARVNASPGEKIPSFCMDRFEATLELIDGKANTDWSPFHNPGKRPMRAVSLKGAIPQQFISGDQAKEACHRAGKRLGTDPEWLRACRGPADAIYPYSWPKDPSDRKAAMARFPAGYDPSKPACHELAKGWLPDAYCRLSPSPKCSKPVLRMAEPCVAQVPGQGAARTGTHPACATPDGIYDLVGNVHEWTADKNGTFRGGYYSDTTLNGPGCTYATTAHSTDHWDYSTGFRCCADLKSP